MGIWEATIYQVEAGYDAYKIRFVNIKTKEERWIKHEATELVRWFSLANIANAVREHRPSSQETTP